MTSKLLTKLVHVYCVGQRHIVMHLEVSWPNVHSSNIFKLYFSEIFFIEIHILIIYVYIKLIENT